MFDVIPKIMNLFRDINIIRNDMRRYKEYILRITQDVFEVKKLLYLAGYNQILFQILKYLT